MNDAQKGWAGLLAVLGTVLLIVAIIVTPGVTAAGKLGLVAMVLLVAAILTWAYPSGD